MTGKLGVGEDFMTTMVMCARTPFFLTTPSVGLHRTRVESAQDCIPASEFRWIFVKTTDTGSYMLEAFTLANNIGHMSLGGACHSVQPLDVRVGGPH